MINIKLYENKIIRDSNMISILELTPVDLYLMSDEAQRVFFENIQRVINQIRDFEVQFVIKTTNMKTIDLSEHIKNLRRYRSNLKKDTEEMRRQMVEKYILELGNILESNFIPSKKIFLVINTTLNVNVLKGENKYSKAFEILKKKDTRIIEMFSKCQIKLKTLSLNQLQILLQDSFRI